ncbi:Rrf2 family transcriptional regulator [Petroclostridium sp. X23]|uniref:RrF2 family transcriptional regulator n=1 Tax=Petroclostridium sp. X23 TaxID=3045146 RepID=UPI0024ADA865|nr:Rrf2 family transcriptional regulator [Petroclostridium sp. X23]WHH57497.1 Rrf2 family transcriptional regulator [Petroclostridium sp. X23]
MKLSRKSEYACLALIDLAQRYNEGPVKIIDICIRKNIPKKYLEQILILLKGSGYVKSVRGAAGGYKLAKPADQINVAEIIRLIDGPLAPVESVSKYFFEHTPIEQSEKLIGCFREIRDYISEKLENTTFDKLL